MELKTILPDSSVALFVKNILVLEEADKHKTTVLPFYADGYPGIMFQQTENGLYVLPHNKKMPELFLYGQTIHPIELKIEGSFRFIVFQLYPFVLQSFFNVNPADLNDDCFDLAQLNEPYVSSLIARLHGTNAAGWDTFITGFLSTVFEAKKKKIDFKIQQALQLIIKNNGRQTIKAIREELNITERTFERRFTEQTGVSPKQFSKMIQFQLSLDDLAKKEFVQLTDVVYKNGFSDQSHFIRVFKAFTGKTPAKFNK
ncbi:MAG: AraC family transcriptional regulator [Bacteroidia bacterium]